MAAAADATAPTCPEGPRVFACRMCGALLFRGSDIKEHSAATHDFSSRKKRKEEGARRVYAASLAAPPPAPCSSIFLHASPPWMGAVEEAQGKVDCPSCHKRLGTFNWAGTQCSYILAGYRAQALAPRLRRRWLDASLTPRSAPRGSWVAPAIQIVRSRVDEKAADPDRTRLFGAEA